MMLTAGNEAMRMMWMRMMWMIPMIPMTPMFPMTIMNVIGGCFSLIAGPKPSPTSNDGPDCQNRRKVIQ